MIEEADRDGDGEIGEDDFIRIMKNGFLEMFISKDKVKMFM